MHSFGGIRTRVPYKRAAAGPRFRRRDHWDWSDTFIPTSFLAMTDTITSQHLDHSSWIALYMTSINKDGLRLVTLCNVIITKPEFLILFARGGL